MNQKGIAHLQLILLAGLVFVIVGFTGVTVLRSKPANISPISKTSDASKKGVTKKLAGTDLPADQLDTSNQQTAALDPKKTPSKTPSTSTTPSTNSGVATPVNQPPTSTNPAISITTPAEGSVITGDHFDITCTTSTPVGFDKVTTVLKDSNGQIAGDSGSYSPDCTSTYYTYMPNGSYTLTVTVHDKAGNTASDFRHITIQV